MNNKPNKSKTESLSVIVFDLMPELKSSSPSKSDESCCSSSFKKKITRINCSKNLGTYKSQQCHRHHFCDSALFSENIIYLDSQGPLSLRVPSAPLLGKGLFGERAIRYIDRVMRKLRKEILDISISLVFATDAKHLTYASRGERASFGVNTYFPRFCCSTPCNSHTCHVPRCSAFGSRSVR